MKTHLHSRLLLCFIMGFALSGYGLGPSALKGNGGTDLWIALTSKGDPNKTRLSQYEFKDKGAASQEDPLQRIAADENWEAGPFVDQNINSNDKSIYENALRAQLIAWTTREGRTDTYKRATFTQTNLFDEPFLCETARLLQPDSIQHLELIGFEDIEWAHTSEFFQNIQMNNSLETLIWKKKQDGQGEAIPERVLNTLALTNANISNMHILAKNAFTLDGETYEALSKLKHLYTLEIHGISTQGLGVNRLEAAESSAFARVFKLPYLETLKLPGAKGITEQHGRAIRHLYKGDAQVGSSLNFPKPRIKTLCLNNTDINDTTLKAIVGELIETLEVIEVKGCDTLTYAAIGDIYELFKDRPEQLKRLDIKEIEGVTCQRLCLSSTDADNLTVKKILQKGQTNLNYIKLENCKNLDYKIIREIYAIFNEKAQQLKELNIKDTKGITYASIYSITQRMPQLKITPEDWATYLSEHHEADKLANKAWFALTDAERLTVGNYLFGSSSQKKSPKIKSPDVSDNERVAEGLEELSSLAEEPTCAAKPTPPGTPQIPSPGVSPVVSRDPSPTPIKAVQTQAAAPTSGANKPAPTPEPVFKGTILGAQPTGTPSYPWNNNNPSITKKSELINVKRQSTPFRQSKKSS